MPGTSTRCHSEHVVPREADMEDIERFMPVGGVGHDARAVDQVDHLHQHAVGQDRMRGGQDEILPRECHH